MKSGDFFNGLSFGNEVRPDDSNTRRQANIVRPSIRRRLAPGPHTAAKRDLTLQCGQFHGNSSRDDAIYAILAVCRRSQRSTCVDGFRGFPSVPHRQLGSEDSEVWEKTEKLKQTS